MARVRDLAAGLLTIAAATALYSLKHDTRRIEADVLAQERSVDKALNDIAALKAERAYLGRPERIETLARSQGLEPIRSQQYLRGGFSGADEADEIGRLIGEADARRSAAERIGGQSRSRDILDASAADERQPSKGLH